MSRNDRWALRESEVFRWIHSLPSDLGARRVPTRYVASMAAFWIGMVGLVAGQLWAFVREHRRLGGGLKAAASVLFVTAGLVSGALDTRWGSVLFAGLVLAALGDLLLIPEDRRVFRAGLGSFLLGHIAYGVAFSIRGVDPTWTVGVFLALTGVAVPVLRWLWPHVERPLRGPVAAYVAVITAMVALAAGTVAAHGNPALVIGAIGFYLSDISVAQGRFVRQSLANRAWGLPLYFLSQLLLASATGFD